MNAIARAIAVAAVIALPSAASAALLDFSAQSFQSTLSGSGTSYSGTLAAGDGLLTPLGYTITAFGGNLTFNHGETESGSSAACLASGLACQVDGLGVKDDEIRGNTNQTITFEFDRSVWINHVFLLDLFPQGPNGLSLEEATISLFSAGGALVHQWVEFAVVPREPAGFFSLDIPDTTFQGTRLVFSGSDIYGDDGTNDYAVAGLIVADPTVIPVPAALPLLVTGLGALALAARRRRQA